MKLPSWPDFLGERNIDLGLTRVEELLRRLGNPEQKLPPIIHVAGTNGKGSTIAFMRAMLEAAGYRVHVYTSPHLLEFNERIVLAGAPITDLHLEELTATCKAAAAELPVTFFEGITVMALLAFSQVEADVVLLETGLGGRLDATNVVSPALTVMTPIGMDHMDYLGDSIEQIAAEKAGIIKQGVPCVVAKQPRDAVLPVLEQHAAAVDAPLRLVVDSCGVDVSQRQLVGQHQADNACTAITALKQLHTVLPLSHEHLQAGISRAQWAGRMQQLTDGALVNRLPQGAEIWLDGGHNDDAVPAILAQIRHWQSCGKTVRPVVAMRDNKDGAALIQALGLACDVVYVTHIPQHDYSADPHVLAQHVRCAQVIDHLTDCYADANSDTVILSCGSLYFVASVLADNAKG